MAESNGAGNSNLSILNSQDNHLKFFSLICSIIYHSATPDESAWCIQWKSQNLLETFMHWNSSRKIIPWMCLSITCLCFDLEKHSLLEFVVISTIQPYSHRIHVYESKIFGQSIVLKPNINNNYSATPSITKATIISFTTKYPLVINHSDSVAKVAYQNQNNQTLSLFPTLLENELWTLFGSVKQHKSSADKV